MPAAVPETRYAQSGDLSIAYQVLGEGPQDILFIPGFVSRRTIAGAIALLVLCAAMSGCDGDDSDGAVDNSIECVRVTLSSVLLESDEGCTVADHPLAQTKLADLAFSPAAGLCFVIGPAVIEFSNGDGETVGGSATAYSGIVTNPIAGAGIAPIDQPCDAEGPVLVFTAATVAELSTVAGEPVGELVMRDTGWAEINLETGFPGFVSERLVVTGGSDGLFDEVTGELYLTGDEFTGAPAAGSMCGPNLFEALRQSFG